MRRREAAMAGREDQNANQMASGLARILILSTLPSGPAPQRLVGIASVFSVSSVVDISLK
jgi:hypothetical protein